MKATINRKELVKAINTVKAVVPRKGYISMLQQVLLTCKGNKLIVSGTDLDNAVAVSIKADQELAGQCTVNCKQLLETVKTMTSDDITLKTFKEFLNITGGGRNGSLATMPADDYPNIDFKGNNEGIHTVFTPEIIGKASQAVKFISVDNQRLALTGVYFEFLKDAAYITATNGHFLAHYEMNDYIGLKAYNFILPAFPIMQLGKVKKAIWRVTIYANRATFSVTSGALEIKMTSKLIEGPYPKYRQVLPESNPNVLNIDRASLLQAVNGLIPCSNKITNMVKYYFGTGPGLKLTAEDLDTGAMGSDEVESVYCGDALAMAFDGKLFKNILESIDTEKIQMTVSDKTSAGMLFPIDGPDDLFLIMPLRMTE